MSLPAHAADVDEVAQLMQAFQALKAQNEAMAARLSALESQQAPGAAPAADGDQADGTAAQEHLARRAAELEAARADQEQEQAMHAVTTEKAALEQRVRELETAQATRNEAFRSLVVARNGWSASSPSWKPSRPGVRSPGP